VARDVKRGTTLPLLTRVRSTTDGGYRSENHDIPNVMSEVRRHLACRPLRKSPLASPESALPKHPDRPLWMVVVRHGKRESLVLVDHAPCA